MRDAWKSPLLLCNFTLVLASTIALSAQGQPPGPPQGRGRGTVELPDGPGKAPVQAYCTSCHTLANIANSGGFTREGWHQLLATMVALPKEQTDVIVEYLAQHFPEQPKPKPGRLAISISRRRLRQRGSARMLSLLRPKIGRPRITG